eukprot:4043701-Pyramimonas_sp.AAC.1
MILPTLRDALSNPSVFPYLGLVEDVPTFDVLWGKEVQYDLDDQLLLVVHVRQAIEHAKQLYR